MKTEHITLATALTILALVVGAVVFYFKQVQASTQKADDLTAALNIETQARVDAINQVTATQARITAALEVFGRNQFKECTRLQIPCEPLTP